MCIGVDHVLVKDNLLDGLVTALKVNLKKQYGVDASDRKTYKYNPEVGQVLNDATIDRLKQAMQTSGGDIIVGGPAGIDREQKYVCPTIIVQPKLDSKLMTEEVFGPILPVLTFKEFDDVINIHIKSKEKPLAIYYAGNAWGPNF